MAIDKQELDSRGLSWPAEPISGERQGFVAALNFISSFALLDPETINVTTLKVLNEETREDFKRGWLAAVESSLAQWANLS